MCVGWSTTTTLYVSSARVCVYASLPKSAYDLADTLPSASDFEILVEDVSERAAWGVSGQESFFDTNLNWIVAWSEGHALEAAWARASPAAVGARE